MQVGDYVRGEDESDWPGLPHEFHRTLADATAAIILADIGMADRGEKLAAKVKSDLERMRAMIEPRLGDGGILQKAPEPRQ